MKGFIKKIARASLWVWQFPQNIVGIIVQRHYERKAEKSGKDYFYFNYHGVLYLRAASLGKGKAVTLGEYVVVSWPSGDDTVGHEFGHVRQSRMTGPLYLLIIGLQSICHAAVHYDLCGKKKYKPYTHFWTERWADWLGGVRR